VENKISNKLIAIGFFLVSTLFFIPFVSAGNYGSGIYGVGNYGTGTVITEYCGDGICNNGETCSSCPGDCGTCSTSPSGGSGGGAPTCTNDWECTNWFPSECPASEIQERVCINRGTCTGTSGMPELNRTCTYEHKEPLFDIFLTLSERNKQICSGNIIKANIKLENYGKTELLDAFMTYWIIDENNKLIVELKDTRAVTKEKEFEIELKIPESTSQGTYRLYAQINYKNNQTAMAGETFEILSEEDCIFIFSKLFNWMYLVYGIAGAIAILLILLIIRLSKSKHKIVKNKAKPKTHKEYQNKIKNNLKKIRGKTFLIILAGFMLAGVLFIGGGNMTGFVVGSATVINNNWTLFGFALIMGLLGLLVFTYRKKIIEKIEIRKVGKHPKNSIKGLIKKKVYNEEGIFIGKIDEVILGENKIDSLKIKLDKKQKFKIKGIIIKYQNVKSVGHIVIVDEKILEKLKS
jgi:sporulation protein YlmC with PRC-barrel domain